MSYETQANGMNPLDPAQPLNSPPDVQTIDRAAHPQNIVLDEDSAVTKAEKLERHGGQDDFPEPVAKRIKVVASADEEASGNGESRSERHSGLCYLLSRAFDHRRHFQDLVLYCLLGGLVDLLVFDSGCRAICCMHRLWGS